MSGKIQLYYIMVVIFVSGSSANCTEYGCTQSCQFERMRNEWMNRFGEARPAAPCEGSSMTGGAFWTGVETIAFFVGKRYVTAAMYYMEAVENRMPIPWRCFRDYCKRYPGAGLGEWENKKSGNPPMGMEQYLESAFEASCVDLGYSSRSTHGRCNEPCPYPDLSDEYEQIQIDENRWLH